MFRIGLGINIALGGFTREFFWLSRTSFSSDTIIRVDSVKRFTDFEYKGVDASTLLKLQLFAHRRL